MPIYTDKPLPQPDPPPESPLAKVWRFANTPLLPTTPVMKQALDQYRVNHPGFAAVGDTAMGMTSPASLALMGMSGGANLAKAAGAEGIAQALHGVGQAASAGAAAHGAYRAATEPETAGKVGGVIEGLAGLLGMRGLSGEPTPEAAKPTEGPAITIPPATPIISNESGLRIGRVPTPEEVAQLPGGLQVGPSAAAAAKPLPPLTGEQQAVADNSIASAGSKATAKAKGQNAKFVKAGQKAALADTRPSTTTPTQPINPAPSLGDISQGESFAATKPEGTDILPVGQPGEVLATGMPEEPSEATQAALAKTANPRMAAAQMTAERSAGKQSVRAEDMANRQQVASDARAVAVAKRLQDAADANTAKLKTIQGAIGKQTPGKAIITTSQSAVGDNGATLRMSQKFGKQIPTPPPDTVTEPGGGTVAATSGTGPAGTDGSTATVEAAPQVETPPSTTPDANQTIPTTRAIKANPKTIQGFQGGIDNILSQLPPVEGAASSGAESVAAADANIEAMMRESGQPAAVEPGPTEGGPKPSDPEVTQTPPPAEPNAAAPVRFFPNQKAAADTGYSEMKAARAAGEPIPEDARAASGRAAQRINQESQINAANANDLANANDILNLQKMSPEDRASAIQRLIRGESGAVDPWLAARMGMAAGGGYAGYKQDPLGNPLMSALAGASLGYMAPKLYSEGLPAFFNKNIPPASIDSGLRAVNDVQVPTLLSPASAAVKLLNDMGNVPAAMGENAPYRRAILKAQLNVPNRWQDFKNGFSAPNNSTYLGEPSPVRQAISKTPLSLIPRIMGGITEAFQGGYREAGLPQSLAEYYTSSNTPTTALGKNLYKTFQQPAMKVIAPIAKIPINIAERTNERLNPYNFLTETDPMKKQIALQRLIQGYGTGAAAYMATPPGFAKQHPTATRMIAASTGPLVGITDAAMQAKTGEPGNPQFSWPKAAESLLTEWPGYRPEEDFKASPTTLASNVLSRFTNAGRDIAQFMDPNKNPVETTGSNLSTTQKLLNRAESNVPLLRNTLPHKYGSPDTVAGPDGKPVVFVE